MRRYDVRITPKAMSQISDAVAYVRDELDMPHAAAELLEDPEEAILGLANMPNRFHAVDVEPLLSAGIRRLNVRKYSVFYRVYEAGTAVDVLAVFCGTPSDKRLRKAFLGGIEGSS